MTLDWKKIGIMAIFFGAVFLFGFFIYYFFFLPLLGSPEPQTNTNINQNNNGTLPVTININGRIFSIDNNTGLPTGEVNTNTGVITPVRDTEPSNSAQGGVTAISQLTNTPSLFATGSSDGKIIYYNTNDGKFYYVSSDGSITPFSDKAFFNVSNTTWSQDRNKAILEYPDGSNVIYDFSTDKQITLPRHWYDFTFAPTDQKIAFKSDALDPENRFLVTSKLDGSQPVILENLSTQEDRFDVNWSPNNQMVATYTKGQNLDRSEVYFVGLNDENFKLMLVEGRDFRGQWSPTGDQMVYSVYNSSDDYKPQLWISDTSPSAIGNNRKKLDLETWADKCTFSSSNKIYCAVPTSLEFGAGLDKSSSNNTPDNIYEIDLNTGAKTLLAIPEGNHTIENIIVDENGNYLFFNDQNNNRIYKINL
jgi:hypothetical protein